MESCKGALQFPLSIGHRETITFVEEMADKYDVGALKKIPAMCVVGMEDRGMPPDWIEYRFRDAWPGGPVDKLPGVGHYLQEDAPEAVSALIDHFIQINNPSF